LENGAKTIAFPAISCGIYGYPIPEAARIAVETVAGFVRANEGIERVRFVLLSEDVYRPFETALAKL
ncbi:MAG TPA: macro domain-containing protein, partial [Candidatus Hydrogenedentes bacterium]|nr:macro domain-containing protein [Candidatus Hydrogenedentota bacterium]